jgi:hypothetical protein
MPADPPDYLLVLRPLASAYPPAVRVRHLLKFALRSCDLKCIKAVEIAPPAAQDGPGDATDRGGSPVRGADGNAATGPPGGLAGIPGEGC